MDPAALVTVFEHTTTHHAGMSKADLHLHTLYSDGRHAPLEIVQAAIGRNLSAISITDHDTMAAYAALAAGAPKEAGSGEPTLDSTGAPEQDGAIAIRLIPGVEFTCTWEDRDLHVLAYGLDPAAADVREFIAAQKRARWDRVDQVLKLLRSRGIHLTLDDVLAEVGHGNPGRPHIARAMVRNRLAVQEEEAFRHHLRDEHIVRIETAYPSATRLIDWVRANGGITSLAHPGRHVSSQALEDLVEAGLDALECIHPSHPYEVQKRHADFAARHALLITGGSDFHGPLRSYEPYLGIVTLSMRHVDALCASIDHRGGTPSIDYAVSIQRTS